MGTHFIAVGAESSQVAELGALSPANPFATSAFLEAMRQLGHEPWILGLRDGSGKLICGCAGFLRKGRLNRTLTIRALPSERAESGFWDGLREFSRRKRITQLELGTFGSARGVEIPAMGGHCSRRDRCEFVIDLSSELAVLLNAKHRASIRKAEKEGLVVRRTQSAELVVPHQSLMGQSMDRRRARGEHVSIMDPSHELYALLDSGSGELFQAFSGQTLVSSAFVLRAPEGAYLHSTGTSPAGMGVGASHFLIHDIARRLQADGARVFNLGGTEPHSSLARFKQRFGATPVLLPSADCYVGPAWRRRVSNAVTLIRSDRKSFVRKLTGRAYRLIVYAADPVTIGAPKLFPDLAFRPLTPEDLQSISVGDPDFRERQLERLARFEGSYAYGVFVEEQLAHISWLLPSAAMERDTPRVIGAQLTDAEITCCETLPAFRGRGIYGVAIANLAALAGARGVRRIYMKTAVDNRSSRIGIEKAGLKRIGSAILIETPITERLIVWRRF